MSATMDDVRNSVRAAGVLATLGAWAAVSAIAASMWFAGGAPGQPGSLVRRPTFDAAALVPTLPHVLVPPALPAGDLVAMVARDIDADGDLDVVANDAMLHLFVWINDGTGRLTRREARHQGGVGQEPAGPGVTSQPVALEPALQSVSFVEPPSSFASVLAEKSRPRSDGPHGALRSAFLADQPSRAPPALVSLS